MMNGIKKLMVGRYGSDQLSVFMLAASILLTLIGRIASLSWIIALSYVPLAIVVYRMFSKDIEKRRLENYKFAIILSPVYSKMHKFKNRLANSKTHKYFKCPDCNAQLRAPKGKSRIIVTCPKCSSKFEKRT
jgi:Zn finger protein HypA/HybF involved in hydrogenase expression